MFPTNRNTSFKQVAQLIIMKTSNQFQPNSSQSTPRNPLRDVTPTTTMDPTTSRDEPSQDHWAPPSRRQQEEVEKSTSKGKTPKGFGMLLYGGGILFLLLILGIVVLWATRPSGQTTQPSIEVPKTVTMTETELQMRLDEARKASLEEAASNDASIPPTPVVVAVPEIVPQNNNVVDPNFSGRTTAISGVQHHRGGSVIRSLGPIRVKDGERYRLMQTTEEGVVRPRIMMYPANRNMEEIKVNFGGFMGLKPPKGKMVVFDTVIEPESGVPMNVFAWQLLD